MNQTKKRVEAFLAPIACDCSGTKSPRDLEKQSRLSMIVNSLETDHANRVELVVRDLSNDDQYGETLRTLAAYLRKRGDYDLANRVAFSVHQITPALAVDGELKYVGTAPELAVFLKELGLDMSEDDAS